ncbi:MAG: hypothetical protein WC575_04905 [Patescibacteria group bacterium]
MKNQNNAQNPEFIQLFNKVWGKAVWSVYHFILFPLTFVLLSEILDLTMKKEQATGIILIVLMIYGISLPISCLIWMNFIQSKLIYPYRVLTTFEKGDDISGLLPSKLKHAITLYCEDEIQRRHGYIPEHMTRYHQQWGTNKSD